MARPDDTELIDRFEEFYRNYYRNDIAELAQKYPSEGKSLFVDWRDLARFDTDLADDFRNKPTQLREYAEEALRLYDLPVDISLGQAHVRVTRLPETTDIRAIRADHRGMLITVQGIVRKATDVRPKITAAAFECQRCGTLTRIPQDSGDFQEPHECQGCERQGPFQINYDQSEFIDAQKLRVQESPEGLRGGETPQSIDINIEDDITGEVTPGDHVAVTGVLKLDQQGSEREKSPMFDIYMDGLAVEIEDEEFEEMDITDEDKKEIIELSNEPDIYDQVEGAIAPSIYGYETEKLAMALQLFSGVTKFLPDGSRTRGDLHMLLIGDPGTGKCQCYDTDVLLADGRVRKLGEIVEENLDDPTEIADGYRQTTDVAVLTTDGESIEEGRATRVWKREAPDQMYRICTASGRELEVTPSHPLFVQQDSGLSPTVASELSEGECLASLRSARGSDGSAGAVGPLTDGGPVTGQSQARHRSPADSDISRDPIESITTVEPDYEWVYDLEVSETHTYISEGVVSHNSALLQYVDNIAPRSVYTSGKGATSAGLCVTGDTLVHTTEGFREIQSLVTPEIPDPVDTETSVEHEQSLYTYNREEGALGVRRSSHVWRMPEKPCHRIETSHGKELEASVNTPVLTCSEESIEWKRIADVSQGEHVAVPAYSRIGEDTERSRTDLREYLELTDETVKLADGSLDAVREGLREQFGTLRGAAAALDLSEDFISDSLSNRHVPLEKLDRILESIGYAREDIALERVMLRHGDSITVPEQFDGELMYLLGLVFGDGDIAVDRRGGNRGCVRLSSSNETVLERAADIVADKFDKHVEIEYQEERVPYIRIYSATIARLFANAGMESPKEQLSLDPKLTVSEHTDAFIRGLMDADGAVSSRENGSSSLVFCTISESLARQVQLMLETFGVRARTRERDRRGTSELESGQIIESKHVQQFLEIYGVDIDRYAEVIGFGVEEKSEQLQQIIRHTERRPRRLPVGSALTTVETSTGPHQVRLARGSDPSREQAVEMLDGLDLGPVEPLVSEAVDADLHWEEVVASLDTGPKEVFDLTVPETHNFVGNGIVTHNTAAAVRDDFGDGQQWTLEAGALVLADRGIAAVDELDKMSTDDQSAMHQALEEQSYHPRTEVLMADGRRVEIGTIVDEKIDESPSAVVDGVDCEVCPVDELGVHTVDTETHEVEKTSIDRVSRHEAPDEFVRVEFSNGRDILVTPEHPMFVADDTVRTVEARNIEEGAFVPAPRKLPNSTAGVSLDPEPHIGKQKDVDLPETVTPELGEILGFLVAEGHTRAGSSHEVRFSNQDERLLARMEQLVASVFGMESSEHTNGAGTVTKLWVSRKLYRWFESNVPEVMPTAREKRIPAAVLGSSEEVIRRFLVGAFAGDGGVEINELTLSTASAGLAQDYADALLKIGVASRIHHDSSHDSWTVCVMGDSTERFVDAVIQRADNSDEQTRALVERGTDTPRHHDVLPASTAAELRGLRQLLGLPLTGRYRAALDEEDGIRRETVEDELATLRERVETVRATLDTADDLAAVRAAIDWSCRQLSERLETVTRSNINHAEHGGYNRQRRRSLTARARKALREALSGAEQRIEELTQRLGLRYYRVSNVETVPNEGEYACDWVYDVTVEPTNTFVGQGIVLHNSISVNKAGINATLKSRCSLLGAANPTMGRFDRYESIAEQIDLTPPLISRFDLIFTVTDQPDPEEDAELAEHILQTNYAGELHTHRTESSTSNYSQAQVERVTEEVAPTIEPDLLGKYIAYARRNCFPTMTEEAKEQIQEFYVDLRAEGTDEDDPVPVTARKLEALVRLAEASARVRLSDTVERADAERSIDIAHYCLKEIGLDPETGNLDADVIETGTSKTQRDRVKNLLDIIAEIETEYDEGAPVDVVVERAEEVGVTPDKAEHEIEKLKQKGEVYEPRTDHLRTT
jgi:replicative DNA helicase Mcm